MTVSFSQAVHRFFDQCAPFCPSTRNAGVLVQYGLVQVAGVIARLHTKTSTWQLSRLALQYILEAQRVGWVMNVRDERFVPGTGYASLSIGRFNELALGVLSNAIRVENVFHSEATGLAGPLNWNWN